MTPFDAEHERLLTEPNVAALTTLRADGTPHTSPIWVDWDGTYVLVNTDRRNAKVRHVEANPQVCVMVVDRNDDDTWVGVSGPPSSSTTARSTTCTSCRGATPGRT